MQCPPRRWFHSPSSTLLPPILFLHLSNLAAIVLLRPYILLGHHPYWVPFASAFIYPHFYLALSIACGSGPCIIIYIVAVHYRHPSFLSPYGPDRSIYHIASPARNMYHRTDDAFRPETWEIPSGVLEMRSTKNDFMEPVNPQHYCRHRAHSSY